MNVFHTVVTHSSGGDVLLPSRDQLVSESLHFQAPLMRNPRRAKKDVVVDGVRIPKDALVLVMIGAGNSRLSPEQSLTFGAGMHVCLGRHLVVAEMRLFVDSVLEQLKTKTWVTLESRRLVDVDVGNFGFSRYVGEFRDRVPAESG
jgi:cytochrome P450